MRGASLRPNTSGPYQIIWQKLWLLLAFLSNCRRSFSQKESRLQTSQADRDKYGQDKKSYNDTRHGAVFIISSRYELSLMRICFQAIQIISSGLVRAGTADSRPLKQTGAKILKAHDQKTKRKNRCRYA